MLKETVQHFFFLIRKENECWRNQSKSLDDERNQWYWIAEKLFFYNTKIVIIRNSPNVSEEFSMLYIENTEFPGDISNVNTVQYCHV